MRIELDGVIFRFMAESIEEQKEWEKDYFRSDKKRYVCYDCGTPLNYKYRVIMKLLDEANLLPDDFKHFCCYCSFLGKVGLLDLREYLSTAEVVGGMIVLVFFIGDRNNRYHEKVEIRVHNYKKVLSDEY